MKRIALIPPPKDIEKEILLYLSFPELMVAVLCSKIWRDTIMGNIDLRKKVFAQDQNTQKKYYEILLSTIKSDSLDECDLYLMSEFDIKQCEGIKGNTVILTDKNTAYFIFKDKIVMKDDKPQVVEGINRQEIPLSGTTNQ